MKTIFLWILILACAMPSLAQVFPARTNGNNTFFGYNDFKKTPTVLGSPVLTNAPSSITNNQYLPGVPTGNGSGFTNLNPSNISPGTAPINITGSAGSAVMSSTNSPTGYYPYGNVACWGDSVTQGTYGNPAGYGGYTDWPDMLSALTGRHVYNGGLSGDSPDQVLARATNSGVATMFPWFQIIWTGNNFTSLNNVTNDIAVQLSATNPKRYVVLSVLNWTNNVKGTSGYQAVTNVNAALSRIYGSHYFDVRRLLVNATNGSAADAITLSNDVTAYSLTYSDIHPNAAGMLVIAQAIAGLISETNFTDRPLMPSDLPNVWSNPFPAGTINLTLGSSLQLNGTPLAYGQPSLYNYFFGGAGNSTMSGNYNTGIGKYSLANNTIGLNNSAFGYGALYSNVGTGNHNTAMGYCSLFANTGNDNVSIGWGSGQTLTAGQYNTFLGSTADVAAGIASSVQHSTAVGYGAVVNASHQIMLGTTAETVVAPGIVVTSNLAVAPTPAQIGANHVCWWFSNSTIPTLYYSYTSDGSTSNNAVKIAP